MTLFEDCNVRGLPSCAWYPIGCTMDVNSRKPCTHAMKWRTHHGIVAHHNSCFHPETCTANYHDSSIFLVYNSRAIDFLRFHDHPLTAPENTLPFNSQFIVFLQIMFTWTSARCTFAVRSRACMELWACPRTRKWWLTDSPTDWLIGRLTVYLRFQEFDGVLLCVDDDQGAFELVLGATTPIAMVGLFDRGFVYPGEIVAGYKVFF